MIVTKNQLYGLPINSDLWRNMKDVMEKNVSHRKEFSREILCMNSLFIEFNKNISDLYLNGFMKDTDCELFSNKREFKDNDNVFYLTRFKAEYNPKFIQLSVMLVIEDEWNNLLLLKKRDGKLSFVKGHVDKYEYIDGMSEKEYLKRNMIRELHEEIRISNTYDVDIKHIGYMYAGNTNIGREHLYSVYKLKIDSFTMKKIRTNEGHKHDCVVISRKVIDNFGYDLDDWCNIYVKSANI